MPIPPECPEECMSRMRFRITGRHDTELVACLYHVDRKLNSMINYDGPEVRVTRVSKSTPSLV